MEKKSLILFGLYLAMFANSLVVTIIFPFASKMVTLFGKADNRSNTGYWVGILTFSMMFGRTITSPIWGCLCDKWGRRPLIIIGMISIILFSLLFGFAQNMAWALISRFLIGVFTPLDISIRTVLSEICPGPKLSSAMVMQSIVYALGNISGNIVGGIFEDPASKGMITSGVFADYPFLLPNVIASVFALFSLILVYPTLQETLIKSRLTQNLISIKCRSIWQIFTDPLVFTPIMVSVIVSLNSTAFHELCTLWFWAHVEDGGFEMDPNDIGIILALSSIILLFFQKQLYGKLVNIVGVVRLMRESMLIAIPLLLVIPIASMFNRMAITRWIVVIIVCVLWHLLSFINFTTSMVISNNSVVPKERGRLNGLYQMGTAIARAIAPVIFGTTFAFTLENGWGYPFNFAFSFNLMALFALLAWILSRNVPQSLDHAKIDEYTEVDSAKY